jgi:hypothetical protein
MSDEQTHLLQEILDAVQEQTALTKEYCDRSMAVKRIALRMVRVLFLLLFATAGLGVALTIWAGLRI